MIGFLTYEYAGRCYVSCRLAHPVSAVDWHFRYGWLINISSEFLSYTDMLAYTINKSTVIDIEISLIRRAPNETWINQMKDCNLCRSFIVLFCVHKVTHNVAAMQLFIHFGNKIFLMTTDCSKC